MGQMNTNISRLQSCETIIRANNTDLDTIQSRKKSSIIINSNYVNNYTSTNNNINVNYKSENLYENSNYMEDV